jgi:5-methylthioadenosine/S-adenosylhomocysteine deaminase
MIAIDLSAPRFLPVYAPMAQLVHTGAGSAITHVWVRGRPLLEEGRLTTVDEDALRARVAYWHAEISRENP